MIPQLMSYSSRNNLTGERVIPAPSSYDDAETLHHVVCTGIKDITCILLGSMLVHL